MHLELGSQRRIESIELDTDERLIFQNKRRICRGSISSWKYLDFSTICLLLLLLSDFYFIDLIFALHCFVYSLLFYTCFLCSGPQSFIFLRPQRQLKVSQLVSWCFEPSYPQRITPGLNTNFTVSPSDSFHRSSYYKSCCCCFFAYLYSVGTQHGAPHLAGWPILFCGPTQEKIGRGFWKMQVNGPEW